MAELASALGKASGWNGRIVVVRDGELPAGMRPGTGLSQQLVLDTSRIRRELGYEERVSRDEGLLRTVRWMREQPPGPDDPMGRLEVDYAAEDAILRKALTAESRQMWRHARHVSREYGVAFRS